jgi:hypothetical protein
MNLRFERLAAREQEPLPHESYDRWLSPSGDVATLFYRLGSTYLLRIPELADFSINLCDRLVICNPVPEVPDENIADFYFNQIIPLVMGADGDLVLHASAVAANGCGIAFLGATGRGKSTLAAAFASKGHGFLSDDGLILDASGDGYLVRPRRPILRLRPDSEAAILRLPELVPAEFGQLKTRVAARSEIPFHTNAVPLTALYLLAEPSQRDNLAITRLSPAAALSEMIGHSFILDVEDRPRMKAHFDRLAQLVVKLTCYSLDYPRRYEGLPTLVDAIIEHAQSGDKHS